ncbi:Putative phosphoglycerol transferase [Elusimicrobium minutum Pei191]|uniref:Putative phosphoglycerol transferase n=1 Tax=Elusimicrobium minutum (strain Pei191) TaxID=445932 RepID=B2KDM5_ELUMP|nr:alkaline phosphatase family protein [Elusimicrobium minutum]ACC98621.1 Putative phosphoglycerol transferase [Elusimicrobium minutum Pei191]
MQKTPSKIKISLIITAGFAIVFTLARLALLLIYPDYFKELTKTEILFSFLNGLRFDFGIIALFAGPLLLLFNLPVKSKIFLKTVLFLLAFVFIVVTGLLAADIIYFGYSFKHITEEILILGNDAGFIFQYVFSKKLLLLAIIVFAAALIAAVNKMADIYSRAETQNIFKSALTSAVIIILIIFGIRGRILVTNESGTKFARKAIGIADVYLYAANSAAANLTLNGVFTSFHTTRKGKVELVNNFPLNEALENAQNILFEPKDILVNKDFPLMRISPKKTNAGEYNFFVVLLEGWSPFYIDSLQGKNYGVTPNFDNIVKNGVNMTNAYSAGARSIFGFGAAFAGVPMLPSLPVFGYGLELSDITAIGRPFNERGYYTIFAQASHRDSYRMCALASGLLDMQDSFGREDIPVLLPYRENASFGYDYDMLMFTADKVKKHDKFLALTFTAITHDPFTVTLEEFEKYPRGSWENEYLNSLYYADFAIGELIKKAKEDGWFDNTVFIFLSDHGQGQKGRDTIKTRMQIPFVIYAPKILKPQTINYTVSQLDLLPTIYNLAGIESPYTALGKDIFGSDKGRVAFFAEGIDIGLMTDKGALKHSGLGILGAQFTEPDFDVKKAERDLLSLEKAGTSLLKTNKWYLSKP